MEAAEWLAVFERMYRENQRAFDADGVKADFASFLARNAGLFNPAELSLLIEVGALLQAATDEAA